MRFVFAVDYRIENCYNRSRCLYVDTDGHIRCKGCPKAKGKWNIFDYTEGDAKLLKQKIKQHVKEQGHMVSALRLLPR